MSQERISSQNPSAGSGSGDPGGPAPPPSLPQFLSPEIEQKADVNRKISGDGNLSVNVQGLLRAVSSETVLDITEISQEATENPDMEVDRDSKRKNRPEDSNSTEKSIFVKTPAKIPKNRNSGSKNSISVAKNGTSQERVLESPEKKQPEENVSIKRNKPKINPKLLILDFYEDKKENLDTVVSLIRSKSNTVPISFKQLQNGGISILFRSVTAKNFVSQLLYEHLKDSLKPRSFIDRKQLFELSCRLPSVLDANEFCAYIKAEKFISRAGKEFIFFFKTKETASSLLKDGCFYKDYLILFQAFVFSPSICCRNCGSKTHRNCESEVQTRTCGYCGEEHDFKSCKTFLKDRATAKESKKKTYAESLGSKLKAPLLPKAQEKPEQPKFSFILPTIRTDLWTFLTFVIDHKESLPLEICEKVEIYAYVPKDMTNFPKFNREDYSYEEPTTSSSSTNEQSDVSRATDSKMPTASAAQPMKPTSAPKVQVKQKSSAPQAPNMETKESSSETPKQKKTSSKSKSRYEEAVIASYERGNVMDTSETPEPPKFSRDVVMEYGEAYCVCNAKFHANPGWKNHLVAAKCNNGAPPYVTCNCGKIFLTLANWKDTYGVLRTHLRDGTCTPSRT
jgi:hypothetical protein